MVEAFLALQLFLHLLGVCGAGEESVGEVCLWI